MKQDKQTGEIQNPYYCDPNGYVWEEGFDTARSSVAQEIFKELEARCSEVVIENCDCPNCHCLNYIAETEVERLSKLTTELEKRCHILSVDRDNVLVELNRVNKRINAGICPKCHRHFTNIQNHISTKHKS